jgi:predicted TIM-barrel fold metal-dependent hydrolase
MYYPDEAVLLRPQNRALWEQLAACDAVVQFHLRAQQADQVAQLAARCPHLRLIVDHMGYPEPGAGMAAFEPILALARCDNVFVKVSDVAGRSAQAYPYADVHPFVHGLLRAFGSRRLMWGTGYPGHHRAKHHWPSLADELRLIRAGLPFLSDTDRDRILGTTAAAVWRL